MSLTPSLRSLRMRKEHLLSELVSLTCDFDDMASQAQLHPTPAYAYIRDYECDSNPAYGVVAESRNQTSTQKPEHNLSEQADVPHPVSLTVPADTVSYSALYMYIWL